MKGLRILTAACALAFVPTLAMAQAPGMAPHRDGSWEFSVLGGASFLDKALADFLSSGTPESRFANTSNMTKVLGGGEVRLGYNITPSFAVSGAATIFTGSGVTFVTPSGAITWTKDINETTSPFITFGTGLTRIAGANGRVTHSTWGADAGVGIRHMLNDDIALRLEARAQLGGYKETPMSKNSAVNPLALIGLSYFIGGRAATPMMAARVDTIRYTRVDTVMQRSRRDTLMTTRVDTVRMNGLDADQVILRVQFQTDRTELLPISLPVLDEVATAIKATPDSRWAVEGHTDNVGTKEHNETLAQGRAQAVVDYLVSKGVDRSILEAKGYGETRPIFANSTPEGRAANRRVQLRRIPKPPTVKVP
jgi:outer membrane protein OmpA-like peptidoglycan-associated protein